MKHKAERFIINNTTVKPVRLGPNGKDQRTIQEKKGYIIQFRDEDNSIKTVSPPSWGKNPAIVSYLPPALIQFHQEGLVRIEKIDDIVATFAKYTQDAPKPAPVEEAKVEEAPVVETQKAEPKKDPKVKVSEMGKQDYSKEDVAGDHGYPGAKNPDGKDNFTVVATGKKKKKNKENTSN